MGGSVVGGVVHVIASAINHNNTQSNKGFYVNKPSNNGNINNLLDINIDSPLEILLQCINILSDTSLFFIFILSLQLFYKIYVSDKPELKWLEFIFSSTYSNKIRTKVYKIIKLNKDMNMIYIVIILVLLIISMCAISYTSLELINNLEKYINVYIEHYKK